MLAGLQQMGLTYRGLYGEGSEVVGNFFQISNQTTLGRSEEELLDQLLRVVGHVVEREEEARRVLLRDAGYIIEDKLWRAYGTLRYARSLTFEEAMNFLSGVRLAVGAETDPWPQCIYAQQAPDLLASRTPGVRRGTAAHRERDESGARAVRAARARRRKPDRSDERGSGRTRGDDERLQLHRAGQESPRNGARGSRASAPRVRGHGAHPARSHSRGRGRGGDGAAEPQRRARRDPAEDRGDGARRGRPARPPAPICRTRRAPRRCSSWRWPKRAS